MPKKNPTLAGVDDYPERSYDDAKDPNADQPREQVDQIADYHETHPTLDTSGKEHDPEFQAKAHEKAADEAQEPQES